MHIDGARRPVEDEQYDAYRSLYADLRRSHPQRVQLSRRELDRALAEERAVCIPIEVGGVRLTVPQLMPVGINDWLNADFYARRFPDAHRCERLLHLTTWPGRDLADRTVEHLLELAAAGVTVVLDGPAQGPWSACDSLERLDQALPAGTLGEPELIGTQTYWCGPLHNPHVEIAHRPPSIAEAARSIGRASRSGGAETGAYVRTDLSTLEADAMYELYESAYAVLGDHPCAQGVDPTEFRHLMLERPEVAKLVFQRDGLVESICLMTPELAELDWINLEYYQQRFGEELDRGRVHWYPAIATDPTSAGARNARCLVELIGELYEAASNPVTILFDTPDMNTAFLPPYLEELINALPHYEVRFEVIAEHEYHAVELRR